MLAATLTGVVGVYLLVIRISKLKAPKLGTDGTDDADESLARPRSANRAVFQRKNRCRHQAHLTRVGLLTGALFEQQKARILNG